ncbi:MULTISPECIES: hypothetical protein [unclassified Adlercreutzia]|uniref:hypothetical protein n=1 Tax=unclassified Adlercreutzia TaxID=2636013 RepID=UPI0013EA8FAA|nr:MULTISPECIES: hypothetical protein [unclassified Adlercreutzia]
MSEQKVKETCIQAACFFLPFFEAGEWRRGEKSPWKTIKKAEATPDALRALASYTSERISHSARAMEALLDIHDDWKVTMRKDGVFMETVTLAYEEILPRLKEAGVSEDDFQLYSEYTRKWGMI